MNILWKNAFKLADAMCTNTCTHMHIHQHKHTYTYTYTRTLGAPYPSHPILRSSLGLTSPAKHTTVRKKIEDLNHVC